MSFDWRLGSRAVLIMLSVLIPLLIMPNKSATYDEVSHLPAGYSYLVTGTVNLNPQHPPLIKELCALPLLFLDMKTDAVDELKSANGIGSGFEWKFGRKFLFEQDAHLILSLGRIPAILMSAGLAALIAAWAGQLWGTTSGLVASFLYVFDPLITAHSQLVTTDIGCAFFSLLFLFTLRRYFRRLTATSLVCAGLCLGLALGTKFSALTLVPVTIVLFLLKECSWVQRASLRGDNVHNEGSRSEPFGNEADRNNWLASGRFVTRLAGPLGSFLLMLLLAWLVLWVLYFFPSDPYFYLKGAASVNRDRPVGYLYYLMGQWKAGRWYSYFLIAWLVKTPLPVLALVSLSLVHFFKGSRVGWLEEGFLVVPALSFFGAYTIGADNLGVRYIIPCIPFIAIFASRVTTTVTPVRGRGTAVFVISLLFWQLVEFTVVFPDHLSYFNEIAGGTRQGFRWLDDSNVDWGQGAIQLSEYLEHHSTTDYRIYYFGTADLKYYGINPQNIGDPEELLRPPVGSLIISSHWLARVRAGLQQLYGDGPGNWLKHAHPREIIGHTYHIYEVP